MNKEFIKQFARHYLQENTCVDVISLQRFIQDREEVGKMIDALTIDRTLEEMAFDGDVICVSGYGIQRVYMFEEDFKLERSIAKTIAVDVDDVVVDLVGKWIDIYNQEWDDDLQYSSVSDWMITDLVKPECGMKMLEILKRDNLYDGIQLVDGAVDGIKELRDAGKRVVFVTAGNHPMKEGFLFDNGLLTDKRDFVYARDKTLIHAGVLLDDGFHNVKNFRGVGFVFDRPWNKKYTFWRNRVYTWEEFVNKILHRNCGG